MRSVTGRRRVAFAVHTDEERLPALAALLRSLALSSPAVCEDLLVLHPPGLADAALDRARRLHPRVVPHETAASVAGGTMAVLAAAERDPAYDTLCDAVADYDTLIALETGTVVRRDVSPLLRIRERVVPCPAEPGEPGEPGRAAEPTGPDLTDLEFFAVYCGLPGRKHPDLLVHCALPLLRAGGGSPGLARMVGSALSAQGRHAEAVRVLAPAAGDPRRARLQEAYGSALMAVSRYEEARTHLLLAAADPDVAPRAYRQLSRLAWVIGEDEEARAHALSGLDAEPTRIGLRRAHAGTIPAPRGDGGAGGPAGGPADPGDQVAHVAPYATGLDDAGDTVLPEAVRRCFGPDTGPASWHDVPVQRLVTERILAELNARRGVVVGGGGLFPPGTGPNGDSGWRWNVPDAMLERITTPLAVFAVGFDVLDGQHVAASRMAGSLRAVLEHAVFFGLRNHGSIDRVRELLPASLADRVRYQPCPTTVLRHLLPGRRDPADAERADVVLLNCAYDRDTLRFGHDYGHFLAQMAEAVRELRDRAEVRFAPVARSDERFVHDLRREHGMTLPVEPLYDLGDAELLDVYRRVRLVIGMREHATLLPFGCGTPAISLVSHPEAAYFLADVDRPEWGVSVHAADLARRLVETADWLLDDHEAAVADVHACQEPLLRVTRANAAEIAAHFGLPAPDEDPSG